MSTVSSLVNRLRAYAKDRKGELAQLITDAADEIEALSLKLSAFLIERKILYGDWIPCSERLPEKSGRYLVTRGLNACGSLWNRVYIVNYSDLMGLKKSKIWWVGNVGKSDFETYGDVIAWMPLPEPYTGGKA